jgi:hypothetical protein
MDDRANGRHIRKRQRVGSGAGIAGDVQMTERKTGYLHRSYAESLSEFGFPRLLPESAGWILQRPVPAHSQFDAVGCYPLFACQDWCKLGCDLDNLTNELVSIAVVTDPFGEYDEKGLISCFPDVVKLFKQHFVTDLSCLPRTFISDHHLRNARKALREMTIEECPTPIEWLDDWVDLYNVLIRKHDVSGIAAFSRASFARQFTVPGMVMLRAAHEGVTVGMLLWYVQGKVAYYHLGAYNERGYKVGASFALFNDAIERFASRGLRWLNLGAGAGASGSGTSGLSRFKEGWATGSRPVYFCGRILDRKSYNSIVRSANVLPTSYFPVYRSGEFQ